MIKLFKNLNLFLLISVASSYLYGESLSVEAERLRMPVGEAPRDNQFAPTWTMGMKDYLGSSYESYDSNNKYSEESSTAPLSKVWFTGAEGVPSEIYWPTVDRPQVRDMQFLITNGVDVFYEEKKDLSSSTVWVEQGVPAYRTISQDSQGKVRITRTIYSDPKRPVVMQDIKLERLTDEAFQFYFLHKPAIANNSHGDNARVSLGANLPSGLYAYQGDEYQSVLFDSPLKKVSASFEGIHGAYQDLASNLEMDNEYEHARNGNVVNMAWLEFPADQKTKEFSIALSFAHTLEASVENAQVALSEKQESLKLYVEEWRSYQNSVVDLSLKSGDQGALFRSSVALIKSMEDKTFEGAFVASPSVPWGNSYQHQFDHDHGAYHLVWPRDLFQMATSFIAIEDLPSARASLQYFKRMQIQGSSEFWHRGDGRRFSKNGTWMQNMWVDGTPYWRGLQMDQVAMPIVLTYLLWSANAVELSDYQEMVVSAADFLMEVGPWTQQERWEENGGYSPSTIAAEIAGLYSASLLAEEWGDLNRARAYMNKARLWRDLVDQMTFTESGSRGNGRYYVRVTGAQDGQFTAHPNPNGQQRFNIRNYNGPVFSDPQLASFLRKYNNGYVQEKETIDGGFLQLVRFGVKDARHPFVLDSLEEYNHQDIRVETVRGVGFRRYTGDFYNYDNTSGRQTPGMLWPLLTGEYGHYKIALAEEDGLPRREIDLISSRYIRSMEGFSMETKMIPEQVWDYGFFAGMPTGSATPTIKYKLAEVLK